MSRGERANVRSGWDCAGADGKTEQGHEDLATYIQYIHAARPAVTCPRYVHGCVGRRLQACSSSDREQRRAHDSNVISSVSAAISIKLVVLSCRRRRRRFIDGRSTWLSLHRPSPRRVDGSHVAFRNSSGRFAPEPRGRF